MTREENGNEKESDRESLEVVGKGEGPVLGGKEWRMMGLPVGSGWRWQETQPSCRAELALKEEEAKLACEATTACEARTKQNRKTAPALQAVIPSLTMALI